MPAAGKSAANQSRHEMLGVALIALALLLVFSLVSFFPFEPLSGASPKTEINLIGRVGNHVAAWAFQMVGGAAYLLPIALGVLGGRCFLKGGARVTLRSAGGFTLLLLFLSAALALRLPGVLTPGGWAYRGHAGGDVGRGLSDFLVANFASLGAHIVVFAGVVIAVLLATPISLVDLARGAAEVLAMLADWAREWGNRIRARWTKEPRKTKPAAVRIIRSQAKTSVDEKALFDEEWPNARTADGGAERQSLSKKGAEPEDFSEEIPSRELVGSAGFVLPSAEALLSDPAGTNERLSDQEIRAQAGTLTGALATFGINGQVIQTHVGPVVTMYEFEPAPGVKVARIVNLADDLALALKATSIRIVAPLPGKAVVGIEVPNPRREDVVLKEILLSDAFVKLRSPLRLALGKDIFGVPVVADLRGMPHLLVAGATGSGKSVGLNTMVLSILFSARPDEVKFLMIDPKMLELTVYDGIPHLWRPVITEPKAAARALVLAVREMERRYKFMAESGARNIETYNRKVAEVQGLLPFDAGGADSDYRYMSEEERLSAGETALTGGPDARTPPSPLPYLVIVIDELADLMMVASKDVEDSISRLAQMARAAGIHLILATQRPSVDVLTGIIKANFPARIAFQVASKTDSRTILDQNGADQLLGRGDMLYLATGTGKLTRVHGGYVPDSDLKKVVECIKAQSAPAYVEELPAAGVETAGEESDRDAMYEKAKEIVTMTGQVSASFLQRRLRIGYPRAARLVEMMESDGIVGAPTRDGRREVLVKRVGVDQGQGFS
jgi:DNA segregation ATPase FtsK/SpoIIIE, S-DNA-T family